MTTNRQKIKITVQITFITKSFMVTKFKIFRGQSSTSISQYNQDQLSGVDRQEMIGHHNFNFWFFSCEGLCSLNRFFIFASIQIKKDTYLPQI